MIIYKRRRRNKEKNKKICAGVGTKSRCAQGQSRTSPRPLPRAPLPPPHPPKRVYFSYFERRQQENESFDDEEENVDVVDEAKRLKHEADQETNMNNRCRKYLQVIAYEYLIDSCEAVVMLLRLLTLDLIRLESHAVTAFLYSPCSTLCTNYIF